MLANVVYTAKVSTCNRSVILLLLLTHLFISVCHGRPAASRHHGDGVNTGRDADDQPNIFAVVERNDPESGNDNFDSFLIENFSVDLHKGNCAN